MTTTKTFALITAGLLSLSAGSVAAHASSVQQPGGSQQDRVGAILRGLFGDRLGVSTTIESQWSAGRKPLATQRSQFVSRIDTDVRSGALTAANGARMKAEYDALVALETRYGADNRFTTQERTDLGDRYGALTQALTEGGFAGSQTLAVAEGRAEFNRRVDAAVTARRLTRTQGTALKNDYAALLQTEASYAGNGISSRERDELDTRLDALDARVGDTAYGGGPAVLDNRTRLANIDRALSTSGLNANQQAQIRVQLGDLTRLEAAYSRGTASNEERAYLERRIGELETRARITR